MKIPFKSVSKTNSRVHPKESQIEAEKEEREREMETKSCSHKRHNQSTKKNSIS
jgi:hypothetical protein